VWKDKDFVVLNFNEFLNELKDDMLPFMETYLEVAIEKLRSLGCDKDEKFSSLHACVYDFLEDLQKVTHYIIHFVVFISWLTSSMMFVEIKRGNV
jgi:hypothetical protein